MASTTSSASWPRATSASARTSCTTPVDVSDKVANTTSISGLPASSRSTSAGSMRAPHSGSWARTSAPNASPSSSQRSPNFPPAQARIGWPGRTRLATADSMAPVPLEVRTMTSLPVWKTPGRRARTRVNSASKSGARW